MTARYVVSVIVAGLLGVIPGSACAGWKTLPHLESARAGLGAAALDGELYVAGGRVLTGPQSTFEVFNPKANLWSPLASLPDGLADFGIASAGGKIFVAGGHSAAAKSQPSAALWIYDKAGARWVRGADMPAPRAGHGLAVVQDKFYVVGGAGPDANKIYVYDPAPNAWSIAATTLPHPRRALAVAVLSGRIYAIGGRDASGANVANVDIFDPLSGKWSTGPALPEARSALTACALSGAIHVTGGQRPQPLKTYAEHLVLGSGAWRKAAEMPTPRHGLASASLDGAWYVVGGGAGAGVFTDFTASDVVEVYRPD